jgi:hypothetical protein
MFTLQTSFKPLLLKWRVGGRVKSVDRGDCEYQQGKHLRLLSQLRPRIWPLDWVSDAGQAAAGELRLVRSRVPRSLSIRG